MWCKYTKNYFNMQTYKYLLVINLCNMRYLIDECAQNKIISNVILEYATVLKDDKINQMANTIYEYTLSAKKNGRGFKNLKFNYYSIDGKYHCTIYITYNPYDNHNDDSGNKDSFYSIDDNYIYIYLHAGEDDPSEIISVLSHEITHFYDVMRAKSLKINKAHFQFNNFSPRNDSLLWKAISMVLYTLWDYSEFNAFQTSVYYNETNYNPIKEIKRPMLYIKHHMAEGDEEWQMLSQILHRKNSIGFRNWFYNRSREKWFKFRNKSQKNMYKYKNSPIYSSLNTNNYSQFKSNWNSLYKDIVSTIQHSDLNGCYNKFDYIDVPYFVSTNDNDMIVDNITISLHISNSKINKGDLDFIIRFPHAQTKEYNKSVKNVPAKSVHQEIAKIITEYITRLEDISHN